MSCLGSRCASADVYFRAKIHPEMKDKMYPAEQVFVRSDDGSAASVSWAKCGCPSGKGPHGSCKHLAAFFLCIGGVLPAGLHAKEDFMHF